MRPIPTLFAVLAGAALLAWVASVAVAPRIAPMSSPPPAVATGQDGAVPLPSLPPITPGVGRLPPLPPPDAGQALPPLPPNAGQPPTPLPPPIVAPPPKPAPAVTNAPTGSPPVAPPASIANASSPMEEASRPMLDPKGVDPVPTR